MPQRRQQFIRCALATHAGFVSAMTVWHQRRFGSCCRRITSSGKLSIRAIVRRAKRRRCKSRKRHSSIGVMSASLGRFIFPPYAASTTLSLGVRLGGRCPPTLPPSGQVRDCLGERFQQYRSFPLSPCTNGSLILFTFTKDESTV